MLNCNFISLSLPLPLPFSLPYLHISIPLSLLRFLPHPCVSSPFLPHGLLLYLEKSEEPQCLHHWLIIKNAGLLCWEATSSNKTHYPPESQIRIFISTGCSDNFYANRSWGTLPCVMCLLGQRKRQCGSVLTLGLDTVTLTSELLLKNG